MEFGHFDGAIRIRCWFQAFDQHGSTLPAVNFGFPKCAVVRGVAFGTIEPGQLVGLHVRMLSLLGYAKRQFLRDSFDCES